MSGGSTTFGASGVLGSGTARSGDQTIGGGHRTSLQIAGEILRQRNVESGSI